jgi:hypothetical protein
MSEPSSRVYLSFRVGLSVAPLRGQFRGGYIYVTLKKGRSYWSPSSLEELKGSRLSPRGAKTRVQTSKRCPVALTIGWSLGLRLLLHTR